MVDNYKFAITYTVCVGTYDENNVLTWNFWRFSSQKEAILIYKLWANTLGAKVWLPYFEFKPLLMPTAEECKEFKRNGWKICDENFLLAFSNVLEAKKALHAKRKRFDSTVRKLLYK